jgi:hypothetical protein
VLGLKSINEFGIVYVAKRRTIRASGSIARCHHSNGASSDPEVRRLAEDSTRKKNWKRWGPYLSARQWGTVREDYSENGNCWEYFTHDQARSRAYRWVKTGFWALLIGNAGFASHLHFGTGKIRS